MGRCPWSGCWWASASARQVVDRLAVDVDRVDALLVRGGRVDLGAAAAASGPPSRMSTCVGAARRRPRRRWPGRRRVRQRAARRGRPRTGEPTTFSHRQSACRSRPHRVAEPAARSTVRSPAGALAKLAALGLGAAVEEVCCHHGRPACWPWPPVRMLGPASPVNGHPGPNPAPSTSRRSRSVPPPATWGPGPGRGSTVAPVGGVSWYWGSAAARAVPLVDRVDFRSRSVDLVVPGEAPAGVGRRPDHRGLTVGVSPPIQRPAPPPAWSLEPAGAGERRARAGAARPDTVSCPYPC